jgi:collagenase-like PrtC family protease
MRARQQCNNSQEWPYEMYCHQAKQSEGRGKRKGIFLHKKKKMYAMEQGKKRIKGGVQAVDP